MRIFCTTIGLLCYGAACLATPAPTPRLIHTAPITRAQFNTSQWSVPNQAQLFQQLEQQTISPLLQRCIQPFQTYTQPINVRNTNLPPTFQTSKSTYLQPVNLLSTTVNYSIAFRADTFEHAINLSNANFNGSTAFEWTIFNGPVNLAYTQFQKDTLFYSIIFKDNVQFFNTMFRGNTFFMRTTFAGPVNFNIAAFSKKLTFNQVRFLNSASFAGASFAATTIFTNTFFNGNLDLSGATFEDTASFENTSFEGTVNLAGTMLPNTLNFSNITNLNSVIDFTTAIPPLKNKKCKINLLGTDTSRIKMHYNIFHLSFPPNTPPKAVLQVYEGLLLAFKTNGFMDDYQALYIEMKQYRYQLKGAWLQNAIEKYGWNYGFNRARIFAIIGCFILLMTLINSLFYEWLMNNAYEVPFLRKTKKPRRLETNFFIRYIFNLPFALVYTLLLLFGGLLGLKREEAHFKSKNVFATLYLTTIIGSGFLCVLFTLHYIVGK
ncbi:MAG: hypothetical protein A3J38_04715 [Gammaproteobacteria bacterium RIFCSPHIGHO2_12_FULL_45_9]|nr:MAG: hypothetical protein A3J38_04715 [Gammaproteobacteria bacterium RIFCSPHIGHO2_12_FULL_45_9]